VNVEGNSVSGVRVDCLIVRVRWEIVLELDPCKVVSFAIVECRQRRLVEISSIVDVKSSQFLDDRGHENQSVRWDGVSVR